MKKPFYFSQKKCWYVRDQHGKAIRLHTDEQEAYRIWQKMVDANSDLTHPNVSFAAIVGEWLGEHELSTSAKQFHVTKKRLKAFSEFANCPAKEIRASLILRWLKIQEWSPWTERACISAIKRVMKWAHAEGYLPKNPLAEMRLKEPAYRTRVVTVDEHKLLVDSSRAQPGGKAFALYLIASHCGARPQQLRRVTEKDVHASGHAWVFQDHKTVDKIGKPLVVYLSPCLQTITKILLAHRKNKPLFLQSTGKPWIKDTVSQRFRRLRERLKLDDSIVPYCYRHTFATDALLAEVPVATVAVLLGHVDSRMVSKVYGHLDQVSSHLLDATAKASKKRLG